MASGSSQLDLITGDELDRELRIRRPPHRYLTVPRAAADGYVQSGWEVVRVNRTTTRIRKLKPMDEALEDEVWSLLARLGFNQMSSGRHFTIPIAKGPLGVASKQIDVLAADDETVLVVECKSSASVGVRPMGKDLAEAHAIRGHVAQALRVHSGIKKKVGWLFVTRGIVWGANDKARADEFKIRVLTDNDLDYFLRLTELIGPAARHQLQAEVFGELEIEGLNRAVPAVRGRIGGRRFYQFTIDPDRLLKVAFISHRVRLDAESVGTYQRMLKKSRLWAIRAYIESGGVFPTNIVVNFRNKRRFDLSAEKADGDVAIGTLFLPNTYKSAWIIDGQHRLYGFAGTRWAKSTQLPVLAFEALPPSEEARMFVDINNKQVRVSRNLLVDLMSELYWDSPVADEAYHALLSRIVAVLGRDIASPFRNRMVQEGETQTADSPLTITAVYEALKKSNLVGYVRKGVFHPGALYEKDGLTTVRRAVDTLSRYYCLYSDALPAHWGRGNGEGGYLCTNNGVSALLLVLTAVIDQLAAYASPKPSHATPSELVSAIEPFAEPVVQIFAKEDLSLVRHYRRQVGNAGQRQAAFAMMEAIQQAKPGFNPPGLDEYIKNQDETGTNAARLLMPDLQLRIQDAALRLLKNKFGPGEAGWWRKGVPEKVRTEVAGRRETNPEGGDYEEFFELLDYRSIATNNWELFSPFFAYGEGKSKERLLDWFGRLNTIRNRIAHPERGTVKEGELTFIEALMAHFDDVSQSLPVL